MTEQDSTVLTEADRIRLQRALNVMPWGGAVIMKKSIASVATIDDLLAWLVELADVLRPVGDRLAEQELEIRKFEAQRRAVREYLGI